MIRYALIAAGLVLFFAALAAVSKEHISAKSKLAIAFGVLLATLFGYFFEASSQAKESKRSYLAGAFSQGKALRCGEFKVSLDEFNYEFGTASFVAKSELNGGNKNLNAVVINIDECELEQSQQKGAYGDK